MKRIATVLMLGASMAICGCKGEGTTETSAETEQVAAQDTAAQGDDTEMQSNTPEASQTDAAAAAAELARQDSLAQESLKKEKEKEEFAEIQSMVKKFYESSVIKCSKKTSKSFLSKYLTDRLITKLIKQNEYGDGGAAVWYMRGDPQDCDDRDKVLSVEKNGENSVIVKFLDCGYTCKVRLDLVKEGDNWKINDYKFLSQTNKSKYSEYNW